MDLSFQTTPLRFLKRIAREVCYQEETADTIVPDSFPDISAITDCYANAVLRGKDCRSGSVILSGGIKAAILYHQDEDTTPRKLELYIPFTTKFENPELREHAQVICTVRIRSVDARMINSRKAMLRVNLGCEMTAYEEAEEKLYTPEYVPETLQLKENTFRVMLPMETAERSFVIADTLELPAGLPVIRDIYKVQCRADLADKKLVGNKGIFKGTLWFKIVYLSEDDNLYVWQQLIPYSQYCEFRQDYDAGHMDVIPAVTGYDLETEQGGTQKQVSLTVHILAQCMVSGFREIHVLEDAFAMSGTLKPEWKTYSIQSDIDRQTTEKLIRHGFETSLQDILDVDLYADYADDQKHSEQCQVTLPLYFRVLGLDRDGRIASCVTKTDASEDFALSGKANVDVFLQTISDISATVGDGRAEIRCTMRADLDFYAEQELRTLCGGEIDMSLRDEKRPSVILRLAGNSDSIWSVAKSCSTSVAAVKTANCLEGDAIQKGTMLLIPIGT